MWFVSCVLYVLCENFPLYTQQFVKIMHYRFFYCMWLRDVSRLYHSRGPLRHYMYIFLREVVALRAQHSWPPLVCEACVLSKLFKPLFRCKFAVVAVYEGIIVVNDNLVWIVGFAANHALATLGYCIPYQTTAVTCIRHLHQQNMEQIWHHGITKRVQDGACTRSTTSSVIIQNAMHFCILTCRCILYHLQYIL